MMHVLLAGTFSGVGSEGEKLATVFAWCVVQIATESSLSERAKLEQRIEDLENSLHTVSPIKTVHFFSFFSFFPFSAATARGSASFSRSDFMWGTVRELTTGTLFQCLPYGFRCFTLKNSAYFWATYIYMSF